MKFFVSIFIIFTIAMRPVLPWVQYAVNYDYIVKNLCENRNLPQSRCNGKCYVQKELAKSEKQPSDNQNSKITGLDVFLSNEIIPFLATNKEIISKKKLFFFEKNLHVSEYFNRIFHPPLG